MSRYSQIREHVDLLIEQASNKEFSLKYENSPETIKSLITLYATRLFDKNTSLATALRKRDYPVIEALLYAQLDTETGIPPMFVDELKNELKLTFADIEKNRTKLEELRKTCLRLCILVNKP